MLVAWKCSMPLDEDKVLLSVVSCYQMDRWRLTMGIAMVLCLKQT